MIHRVIFTALFVCIAVPAFAKEQAPKTLRVYFVGNSVTDTINYRGLAELAKSRGYKQVWGRHMIPGAPLQWIWEHPKDGFQEPPFGHYPNALANYQWDVLCLQPFDRHLDGKDGDVAMAKNFIDLALKKSPDLHVFVYARWPRQGKDDFDTAWQKKYTGRWDNTNETKDYFERLTLELRKAYPKLKIHLVPVGHVMYGLNQWMKAGKIPGYTDIKQLFADGIHLNNVGSYVVACTFFATLYKQSPTGLPSEPYKVTDPKLAAAIQDVALRVVKWHELAGILPNFNERDWKVIADVVGCDRLTNIHVPNLLASKGIDCVLQGSIFYGVWVPKQHAATAIQVLREDAQKRDYAIWFDAKHKEEVFKATTPKKISCLPVSQLSARPEFAEDKPLGRWLRNADLSAKLRDYPFVESLEIYEREYLATQDKPEIGYDIEIELRPRAGDKSSGFLGRYQVWRRDRELNRMAAPNGNENELAASHRQGRSIPTGTQTATPQGRQNARPRTKNVRASCQVSVWPLLLGPGACRPRQRRNPGGLR